MDENAFLGFVCDCEANYQGQLCEQPIDPCSKNPCPQNSRCISENDQYRWVWKKIGCYDFKTPIVEDVSVLEDSLEVLVKMMLMSV